MQITISEFEIKSAIRTFIHDQIKINPGMKIEIDLKATRGAEGATAIIDIVPDQLTGQMTAAVQEPKKEKAEPIAEIKATSAKLFTAPKQNAYVVDPVTEDEEPPITAHVQAQDEHVPPVTEAPVLVPDAEVPVPARTSLFSNLKKPVNV